MRLLGRRPLKPTGRRRCPRPHPVQRHFGALCLPRWEWTAIDIIARDQFLAKRESRQKFMGSHSVRPGSDLESSRCAWSRRESTSGYGEKPVRMDQELPSRPRCKAGEKGVSNARHFRQGGLECPRSWRRSGECISIVLWLPGSPNLSAYWCLATGDPSGCLAAQFSLIFLPATLLCLELDQKPIFEVGGSLAGSSTEGRWS